VTSPLRIAIADDHELFREALKSSLDSPQLAVVAEIARDDDLAAILASTQCDILLLDLERVRGSLEEIEAAATRMKVIALTAREQPDEALAALRAGARGVVFKRLAVRSLVESIHAVADGHAWMPPEIQAVLLQSFAAPAAEPLTAREREIVRLVAAGLRNAEIAARLCISGLTVKSHLGNVFEKLRCRDRVDLVLYARRLGLVDPAPRVMPATAPRRVRNAPRPRTGRKITS
jgi:DNA-binding NarL/FixJ family response regulator